VLVCDSCGDCCCCCLQDPDEGALALPGAVDDGDGPIQLVHARHSEDEQSDAASEPGQGKPSAAGGAPAGDAASASEASATVVGDGGIVSDYSRGKRLRKLARLLSSKAATQVGRTGHYHSY
jgi:hypothetical protein